MLCFRHFNSCCFLCEPNILFIWSQESAVVWIWMGRGIAQQLLEPPTEKPRRSTDVALSASVARDFSLKSTFGTDSLTMSVHCRCSQRLLLRMERTLGWTDTAHVRLRTANYSRKFRFLHEDTSCSAQTEKRRPEILELAGLQSSELSFNFELWTTLSCCHAVSNQFSVFTLHALFDYWQDEELFRSKNKHKLGAISCG